MKISVICVTARVGGFDVLVNGFNQQQFEDFEVIVVDSCYDLRKLDRPLPPNYVHVKTPDTYTYYDACFASNFGLKHASGELIVPFSDFNWPDPNLLADAWQVYKDYPGYSMTGYLDRFPLPPLKPVLDWQSCSWSLFEAEFTAEVARYWFSTHKPEYQERKGANLVDYKPGPLVNGGPYHELPPDKFYVSLNETIPMAVLKEIGGYDEMYDGAYGSSDVDLGCRAYAAGWRFLIKPDSINRKFGCHETLGAVTWGKPTIRPSETNFELFSRRIAESMRPYKAVLASGWNGVAGTSA